MDFGVRPISMPKIENFTEQNVKEFQFNKHLPNFGLLGSIIIKKSKSRPIFSRGPSPGRSHGEG